MPSLTSHNHVDLQLIRIEFSEIVSSVSLKVSLNSFMSFTISFHNFMAKKLERAYASHKFSSVTLYVFVFRPQQRLVAQEFVYTGSTRKAA